MAPLQGVVRYFLCITFITQNMSEKPEYNSVTDGEEQPKKKATKWEAVPIPMGIKTTSTSQSNAQSSFLNNAMDTAGHAMKGKDQKENWQRIQRTTFTNWINNRLQGAP